MSRSRTILAAVGLAATTFTTVGPVAAGPAAAQPTAHPKPLSAGSVSLDVSRADEGLLTATSDPVAGLGQPRIIFAATGDAEVTGTDTPVPSEGSSTEVTATIEVEPGAEPADPVDAALADAAGSTVIATLRGDGDSGGARTSSDRVWVDELRGRTLVSATGEQDLRLQRVDVLEDEGELAPPAAEDLRERIRGGGATTQGAVTPAACAGGVVCVTGTVLWTDVDGGTHPVDRAPVRIFDEDGATDVRLDDGTVLTDASGRFAATLAANDDGDGTGLDPFVRVLADGPGFTLGGAYVDSTPQTDVPDGAEVTLAVTTNNADDNNTAFSVRAALVFGHDQVAQLRGAPLAAIPVEYPDAEGSYYDGDALHVLGTDRFDWDVVLHEYGHYVADSLDIESNPGGPHSLSANLSDTRRSKAVGTRLAWGEGWPSWFAVSTLHEDAADLGVPNVGDARYQDTVDSSIDVSLEVRATLGEDNERTVMNILWDLHDAQDDGRDRISLGVQAVWDTVDAGDPIHLSQAYALFSPNKRREPVNCVFTDMNVAPRVDGPSPTAAAATPPTIRWRRGNGGTHRNDQFSVVFRDAQGGLLHNTGFRTGQSYRPPPDTWRQIRARSTGAVRVSVVGRQTDPPSTGPYRSCTRVFTLD